MKLEELLGEDLYKQVQAKIDEHNEKEQDKQKHVKYADLSEGEYVSKAKYTTLEEENKNGIDKLNEANALIDQLKKATKSDDALQGKVTEYENKISDLEEQLTSTKIETAIKVGLLAENAVDVDYLTYKLKETSGKLELDEKGSIKGWSEKIDALKTQLPNQFNGEMNKKYDGFRPINKQDENPTQGMNKAEFMKKSYAEQAKFANENPDAYHELMKE